MATIRKKKNFKGLQLSNDTVAKEENKTPPEIPALELGLEFKLDLKNEDLQNLNEIGSGNGGTVTKVLHVPTKTIMAKKVNLISIY
jgi:mitogen-activated protein kinase kinase